METKEIIFLSSSADDTYAAAAVVDDSVDDIQGVRQGAPSAICS